MPCSRAHVPAIAREIVRELRAGQAIQVGGGRGPDAERDLAAALTAHLDEAQQIRDHVPETRATRGLGPDALASLQAEQAAARRCSRAG